MSTPAAIATVIIGVFVATAVMGWLMWRLFRSAERMERDPKYRRRRLIRGAMIYVFGALFGMIQVARGELPIQALIGLPISLFMIWVILRTASKVKIPPN
jgi:cell division protein FtsW (lipid II flippase)